jgi:NADPH-dependent F420 reductase
MTSIGLLGGTGDLGTALALHLSKKNSVFIGSRSQEKADMAVDAIIKEKGERDYLLSNLKSADNAGAISKCEFIIATLPSESAIETVKSLSSRFRAGQTFISAIAALSKKGTQFFSPRKTTSLTEQIRSILPDGVEVSSAFQTLPAAILYREKEIVADILVCAESKTCFDKVSSIVSSIDGLRPLYLGDLELAGELEALTALLLNVGIRNKLKSPTIRISSF